MADVPGTSQTAVAPARVCAYAVLRRVFEGGAYADRAFQAQARELDARDRALAMRLAYGAIQRRATLDSFAERIAARPIARLDDRVVAALRLGLYELLYMDSAPDHAVVADVVELAKAKASRGHGLVNAVLRRAARERPRLLASLTDETPEGAAIMHSHPEWVARLWFDQLGADQARALMACDNDAGEIALRVNALWGDRDRLAAALPVATHGDPTLPEALVLDGPFDAHAHPLWGQGAFVAQSRAAMLVARAVAPRPGERVLDLCAAPGGKSTHLAALMEGAGEVVAVELNPRRADQLRATATRLGAHTVTVEVADAAVTRSQEARFDRVLVDPPCSGLGTLQARADLRWRMTAARASRLADVQSAILAAGARSVRSGGVLVYSTCTISAEENESRVAGFLAAHPDFALDDLATGLAPHLRHRSDKVQGCVSTLPHRDRTAGFFIARMIRA